MVTAKEEPEEPGLAPPDIERVVHTWVVDLESPSISIENPRKVTVLISSREVGSRSGNRSVAVVFEPGKGRVLHVLSHFGKQGSFLNEATIENLLVNFLLDGNVRIPDK